MEIITWIMVVMATLAVIATIYKLSRPTNSPREWENAPTDPMLSPIERGKYMKDRKDIPVDTGGLYQGEDEENMAAMVRAAFLTGDIVIGNVNDEGELEIETHPIKGRR